MTQPAINARNFCVFRYELQPQSGIAAQPPPYSEINPLCQVFIFESSTRAHAPRETANRSARDAARRPKPSHSAPTGTEPTAILVVNSATWYARRPSWERAASYREWCEKIAL